MSLMPGERTSIKGHEAHTMSSDTQYNVTAETRAAERHAELDSGNPYLVDMRTLALALARVGTMPPISRPQEPNNAAAGAAAGRAAGESISGLLGKARRLVSSKAAEAYREKKARKLKEKRDEELHQMSLQKHDLQMRGGREKLEMNRQKHNMQMRKQKTEQDARRTRSQSRGEKQSRERQAASKEKQSREQ
jgi:hypothetical protein